MNTTRRWGPEIVTGSFQEKIYFRQLNEYFSSYVNHHLYIQIKPNYAFLIYCDNAVKKIS